MTTTVSAATAAAATTGSSTAKTNPNLCCRKFFLSQIRSKQVFLADNGEYTWRYRNLEFDRVWIQGCIVELSDGIFVLDDGTGTISVDSRKVDSVNPTPKKLGMFVMVIGLMPSKNRIVAHKVVDLNDDPNRETMWYLEVIDLHKTAYA
eukprot:TRINITY_DN2182_c0_g1_i3.p1 TRINITY_DN2182_c0_g1~~TRINITY_DN2182_c0_g1_i3.p1  ORF type:complete len:149 (-),score=34.89 TRINITY_DN2182_c0_g1_i3:294-740(-)